jgi:hypothetical protein
MTGQFKVRFSGGLGLLALTESLLSGGLGLETPFLNLVVRCLENVKVLS